MTSIFSAGGGWHVTEGDEEWVFTTYQAAQTKAAELIAARLKSINEQEENEKQKSNQGDSQ